MNRRISAWVAVFGLMMVMLVATGEAQIHGAPSSVTSPGFGGHAINGAPASVTSLGRNGYAPAPGVQFRTTIVEHRGDVDHHHHSHNRSAFGDVYAFPVAVPVAVPADPYAGDDAANADDAEDQGGPTIFDRRGAGADSYVPPVENAPAAHMLRQADADPDTEDPPAMMPTLLVFKDQHKLEVSNYAIVGSTLFDLTPGHARRVALADLDLEATAKENDDRGVTFQLPPMARAN